MPILYLTDLLFSMDLPSFVKLLNCGVTLTPKLMHKGQFSANQRENVPKIPGDNIWANVIVSGRFVVLLSAFHR